jgi:hypothetical protein
MEILLPLFIVLALYLSLQIGGPEYATYFLMFLTFGGHAMANHFCSLIASYRYKNPKAKYFEIKNKVIRGFFVRTFGVKNEVSKSEDDHRTNIIGFVLNIVNLLLLVAFEILLCLPPIPCEPRVLPIVLRGSRPRRYEPIAEIELDSLNEMIPAYATIAFLLLCIVIFLIFLGAFERQLKEKEQKRKWGHPNHPPPKKLKKTKWHAPLYFALIDLSVRQNNKKLKYWYDVDQLPQIEDLLCSASEHAEVRTYAKNGKLVSFEVVDTLNEHVVFRGLFMQ